MRLEFYLESRRNYYISLVPNVRGAFFIFEAIFYVIIIFVSFSFGYLNKKYYFCQRILK